MTTVSAAVKGMVQRRPYLEEALMRGIINYAALAKEMRGEIGKDVSEAAIIMALRRLSEGMNKGSAGNSSMRLKESDITMKSGLFEITFVKSPTVIGNIRKLYSMENFERGDFLAITHGMYEVTIITNRKYKSRIEKLFQEEKTIKTIDDLTSLTINIPIKAVDTVGLFYLVTKSLNWENINIVEIVSTLTEMTIIIREDDASRTFNVMKEFVKY